MLELGAVELRVAQGQVAPVHVSAQLAPAAVAEPHEILVHPDEVFWWGDVVIDEHHPVLEGVGDPRHAGPDREVVDQDVVGLRGVDQIPVVVGERLQPRIGGLDEDLGCVTRRAQHRADTKHLVAYGIAIAERGQYLMHRGPPR